MATTPGSVRAAASSRPSSAAPMCGGRRTAPRHNPGNPPSAPPTRRPGTVARPPLRRAEVPPERGGDPGTEVDVAGERGHGAFSREPDPVLDLLRGRGTLAFVAGGGWRARTTGFYTPHRQRWFAMRSLIVASLGCGSCA